MKPNTKMQYNTAFSNHQVTDGVIYACRMMFTQRWNCCLTFLSFFPPCSSSLSLCFFLFLDLLFAEDDLLLFFFFLRFLSPPPFSSSSLLLLLLLLLLLSLSLPWPLFFFCRWRRFPFDPPVTTDISTTRCPGPAGCSTVLCLTTVLCWYPTPICGCVDACN